MIKSIIKPIYIYISKKVSLFSPTEYYIVHDLIDLEKLAIFEDNSGSIQMNFSSTIANIYLIKNIELFKTSQNCYKTINDCHRLIEFNELLDLIVDVSNETNYNVADIVNLLRLVVAKWDDWY